VGVARRIPRLGLLAALLLLAACTGDTGQKQSVLIPEQQVPGSRVPDRPLTAVLVTPDGPGPFPVVILLHGCSGLSGNETFWADRLRRWGYASLIPDSFDPRWVTKVCMSQSLVTAGDRAADVLSAALTLRALPAIDGARIAVMGFSHGGWSAAWMTRREYEVLYPGLLAASVDYYGPCGSAAVHGTVPLLALAGEADSGGKPWPAVSCRDFGNALQPDQPFELHTYPGVVHAFDDPVGMMRRYNFWQGGRYSSQYDPAAATDSFARVHAFPDKWVRNKAAAD
jgi:dienelactone hydrolase